METSPCYVFPHARHEAGTMLIVLIGVLAVMTIGLSIVSPSFVHMWDRHHEEAEVGYLHRIADGILLYLKQQKNFPPTLASLSPDYLSFPSGQLMQNDRGFARYYFVHPTMSSFNDATGLSSSQLPDARVLLISNLTRHESPAITNATEFETWWATDESTTPGLHIHRSNMGFLFHLLTINQDGNGGSYQLNGTGTNSGGAALALHSNYHLSGTSIQFDEADSYVSPEVQFALTSNTTYWFDPNCTVEKKWNPLDPVCGCSITNLPFVNPDFETGDITGWTKTIDLFGNGGANHWGAVTSANRMSAPHGGTYFAEGMATGSTGTGSHLTGIYQRIDISACAIEIDKGNVSTTITVFGHGETNSSKGKMRIVFFDAVSGGTQLGSYIESAYATQTNVWEQLSITAQVPSDTKSIEILLLGEKHSGSNTDAGFDDISGIFSFS